MHGPEDASFDGESFDPDDMVWVSGVDYVTGWRDATQAAAELGDALSAAGVDTGGAQLRAGSAADGTGRVRVELSATAVRQMAALMQTAAQWRRAS